MSSTPLVSIVIPVYNGSNYLRQAIDSALAQTYSNIEILVINDGSNDDGKTADIAKSYGTQIRYFEQKNGGVASALNLGIEKMRGQYFSWLSHDDMYVPDKVEKQVALLQKRREYDVVVLSDYSFISEDGTVLDVISLPEDIEQTVLLTLARVSVINGCTLLVPKVCFEKVGVFNTALKTTQDYDLWFRIAQHFPFATVREPLVLSRRHAEQDSRKLIRLHQDEVCRMHTAFFSYIVDNVNALLPMYSRARWFALTANDYDRYGEKELRNSALKHAWKSISLQSTGKVLLLRVSLKTMLIRPFRRFLSAFVRSKQDEV